MKLHLFDYFHVNIILKNMTAGILLQMSDGKKFYINDEFIG